MPPGRKRSRADDVAQDSKNTAADHARRWQSIVFARKCCQMLKLPSKDGNEIEVPIVNLWLLWEWLIEQDSRLGDVLERFQGTCLDFICYTDEVTPGNVIAVQNRRKSYVWYISALQFGIALMDETYWWAIATMRTEDVNLISGGFSTVCFHLFQSFLDFPLGHLFKIKQEHIFLSGKIKSVIMDEAALHAALSCKGSSGQKPCYKCGNIVSKQFHAKNPSFATLHAVSTELQLMTDQHIVEVLLLLQRQKAILSNKHFAEMEKTWDGNWPYQVSCHVLIIFSGSLFRQKSIDIFTRHSHTHPGFLLDDALSTTFAPSIFCFDPMHIFYQTGVASTAVGLIRRELSKGGLHLKDFFDTFSSQEFAGFTLHGFPHVRKCFFKRVMDDVFFTTDHCWRASASTHLTVIPLLAMYIEMMILPTAEAVLVEHCQNFLQLALVLAFYRVLKILPSGQNALKPWGRSTIRRYAALYDQYLSAFHLLYGKHYLRPKHHYAHHIIHNWEVNAQIVDCFCLERKHRVSKAKLNNLKDLRTSSFCKGYLFAANSAQEFWISQPTLFDPFALPQSVQRNVVLWSPSENWCGIILAVHRDAGIVEFQTFHNTKEHFLWFRTTGERASVKWSCRYCYVCHGARKDDLLRLLI